MEGSGSEGVSLVFLLQLLLWEPAAPHCAPSLGYTFTITPNGQPWCEIQGQVNGNTFLHYTCGGDKVRLIRVLEMNATQAWSEQRDALQYVVEELKKTLLDIKAEIPATRGPRSLQGSMMCEQESNGLTAASCEFGLDGQISLRFDTKNRHWTVLHGEGILLKQTLASDRAMTNLLVRTSAGDCRKWLQQVLCPLSTQAAPTTATATVPSKATTNTPIPSVLPVIPTCAIIVGILGWALSNRSIHAVLKAVLPKYTSQEPNVETIRDAGGEGLRTVPAGSPVELVHASGAVPEVTGNCEEPLLPKSTCAFE